MGRKTSIGSVECIRGAWRALVTFPRSPTRPVRVRQWWSLDATSEAAARAQALKLMAAARAGKIQPADRAQPARLSPPRPWDTIPDKLPDGRETVKGWSLRWLAEREKRGHKSGRSELSCLRTWVWPRIGHLAIATVTRGDIEAWVEATDDVVRDDERKGRPSWKTALNAWGLVSKVFTDACAGKPRELRVRADDPTERVAPPDRGVRKGKQFLYPSEVSHLMACDEVDPEAREVYAVAVYLYPRAGELEALHCEDIDLAHGTVNLHRARDPDTGEIRETKGNRPRRIPIHPNVAGLLEQLHTRAGGRGLLWPEWPLAKDRSGQLKRALLRAGADRGELHEGDATRKAMTFHDLRATGITWEAIVGTDLAKIQQRAGHTTTSTTLIYVRLADSVRGVGFGEPFPPLPRIGSTIGSTGGAKPLETPTYKAAARVRGEGFEPDKAVASRSEPRRNAEVAPPAEVASMPLDAPGEARGSIGGSNRSEPREALATAVRAALDGGDLALAAELLDILRRQSGPGTPPADVVDLGAVRARLAR